MIGDRVVLSPRLDVAGVKWIPRDRAPADTPTAPIETLFTLARVSLPSEVIDYQHHIEGWYRKTMPPVAMRGNEAADLGSTEKIVRGSKSITGT